jgi:hypothetical protein
MKKSMILIAMAALMLMVTGCRKEEYASPAAYGKVFCDMSHPKVGDEVLLKAEVADWGDCINSATYTWTIKKKPDGPTKTITNKVYRQSGDKSLYEIPCSDPWIPTAAGQYTISMSAEFRYTLGDANSVMFGTASAKDGTVTIYAE